MLSGSAHSPLPVRPEPTNSTPPSPLRPPLAHHLPTPQVLVATSTLAWGVNTPAHLVVIKGTEFFDAPTKRYVDMPITDILQVCLCVCVRVRLDLEGVCASVT